MNMRRAASVSVVTNLPSMGQQSMLGYGQMLLGAVRDSGRQAIELSHSGVVTGTLARLGASRLTRMAQRFDRVVSTPLELVTKRAQILHVADHSNAVYMPLIRADYTVVTVHDMIPFLCAAGELSGFEPSRAGRAWMAVVRQQLCKADSIVCDSESTRRDVIRIAGVDESRIRTIPLAVFQTLSRVDAETIGRIRTSSGLGPGEKVVIHIGRNFYKNRETVIDAFAELKRLESGVRLVMVGAMNADLADRARRLGLVDDIVVLKHVAGSDMSALYSMADVLVFPSLYEGFGYPVLEAQMCGTPVVASHAGSLAEVAGSSVSKVEPRDARGIADAIAAVLSSESERHRLIEAGYGNVQKFSYERWFTRQMAVYRDFD